MKKLLPLLAIGTLPLVIPNRVHAQDPIVVPCNGDTLTGTYCYVDNDSNAWHWQSECGAPITLEFISGTIESNLYDLLRIYNGPVVLSPVSWVNGSQETDLAGMSFVGNAGELYMEMTSNDTICCATIEGFRTAWDWVWKVSAGAGSAGIAGSPASDFSLYPNPVSAGAPVRLEGLSGVAGEIRIQDVAGRSVQRNGITGSEGAFIDLELNGLQSGLYHVVITTPDGVRTRKLQIVR